MFSAENPGGGWSVGNSWQGSFPTENSLEDGFAGLAPATAFAPNALGVRLRSRCLLFGVLGVSIPYQISGACLPSDRMANPEKKILPTKGEPQYLLPCSITYHAAA